MSLTEAFWVWTRVAALSFGGPAGQIAVMHRIIVDEKRWVGENRFLHALSYCMLLPGPEAQQLATYIGWLLHGTRGGLVAGLLFVLPGLVAIMALSFIYVTWGGHPLLAGVFLGLKAAVIALVIEALIRIARRALKGALDRILAVAAFVAGALPYTGITDVVDRTLDASHGWTADPATVADVLAAEEWARAHARALTGSPRGDGPVETEDGVAWRSGWE